jgi:hypothetical protein
VLNRWGWWVDWPSSSQSDFQQRKSVWKWWWDSDIFSSLNRSCSKIYILFCTHKYSVEYVDFEWEKCEIYRGYRIRNKLKSRIRIRIKKNISDPQHWWQCTKCFEYPMHVLSTTVPKQLKSCSANHQFAKNTLVRYSLVRQLSINEIRPLIR